VTVTLCAENQFASHIIDHYCDIMWKIVPEDEQAEITPEQWRFAALLALLQYWAPAGTA
jgi:hypothetical protein